MPLQYISTRNDDIINIVREYLLNGIVRLLLYIPKDVDDVYLGVWWVVQRWSLQLEECERADCH